MNRDFKGIWIPREIWLNPNLSMSAKALWAEIDSLYSEEVGGCYASNEYLCEFMQLKERRLREVLSELKAQGFVEEVSFDGRRRTIKAVIPEANGSEKKQPPSRQAEKCRANRQKSAGPSYIENKGKERNINTKKNQKKIAFGEYQHVKLTQTEYDNLLQDFGEEKLLYWIKQVDEWCEENGNSKKNYNLTIRNWEKKSPNQHKEKANPKEGKNKASAEKCKKNLQGQAQKQGYEIEVLNDRIKIKQTNGNNNDFVLNYSEEGFHEQLVNQLRKLKII